MMYLGGFRMAATIALVLALCAGLWLLHRDGYKRGAADIRAQWQEQTEKDWAAYNEALTVSRTKEQTLANQVAELQRKRTDENTRHAARERSLLDQLRNRPERTTEASGVPTDSTPGAGCTGAGLARPDAEFLAGYAADAARLQSALNQCEAAYESARKTLE